ncbi:unnamed protein product, partial [Adineta steineri]
QQQQPKKPKQQTKPRSEATETLENALTHILDQRIDDFLKNPNAHQLQFEDGLSPFGRRYVHELAEKHNLQHMSEGTGDQRHITVMKKSSIEISPKPQQTVKHNIEETNKQFRTFSLLSEEKKDSILIIDKNRKLSTEISSEEIISTEKSESPVLDLTNRCRYCHKDIPPQNLQLHQLYCERVNPLPS